MDWVLVLIFFVLAIGIAIVKIVKALPQEKADGYRKQDAFLTPAERSFYGVLRSVINDRLQIFAKVRVADVITPAKGLTASDRQKAFNRISAKHFDFVLCDPADLSVVCGLELDDKSHNSKKRKLRDELLQTACDSAALPLVRFKAEAAYTRGEIEQALTGLLPVAAEQPQEQLQAQESPQKLSIKSDETHCPKCGSQLVKRTAKKGKHVGKEFVACSTYPACRYILENGGSV